MATPGLPSEGGTTRKDKSGQSERKDRRMSSGCRRRGGEMNWTDAAGADEEQSADRPSTGCPEVCSRSPLWTVLTDGRGSSEVARREEIEG